MIINPLAHTRVVCVDSTSWESWEGRGEPCMLLDILVRYSSTTGIVDGTPWLEWEIAPRNGKSGCIGITARSFNIPGSVFILELPEVREWQGNWLRILKTVFAILPQNCIRALKLSNGIAKQSKDQWVEVFKASPRLPHLRTVRIGRDFNCDCLAALLALEVSSMPSLQKIYLDAGGADLSSEKLEEMKTAIVSCRQRGVPLDYITLRGYESTECLEPWAAMLATVIPQFRLQIDPGSHDGGLSEPDDD
ncbi:hypothetical protein EVG20_g10170 [Dentipellis fragilis]|uniref:F-box domain-containing protein n=1 Tax=Dentipellis fragilis TaxID=205917 RepID=A0A4Y9XXL2_9AGAM|nr:hypothetical protein EVG20_g10170 [Dentipellis fragilis]